MKIYKLLILTITLSGIKLCHAQVWKTYVPYNKKGLWGYADTSCKLKVQPFTRLELGFFNDNGIALTKDTNGNYGVINSVMKTVLTPKYKSIDVVNNQFLKLEIDDYLYQLYSLNGLKILPFNFNKIVLDDEHPNDVLVFQRDDLLSVYKYDKKLKKLILKRQHKNAGKANFVGTKHYSVTFHYTLETKTYNILTGKEESAPHDFERQDAYDDMPVYDYVKSMDERKVRYQPVTYFYTDSIEDSVRFEMEVKNYYNRNLKHVKLNGKWGVISYDRKIIVPLIYDSLINCVNYSGYDVSDNSKVLAWLCKLNHQYGIVSTDSIRNTEFVYDNMYFFSSNYIMVKQHNKLGVLDYFGKTIIPCEVDSFKFGWSGSLNWSTCRDVLILFAVKGNKLALYDTKGGKTDYTIDEANDIYDDKNSVYGFTRSIKLKSDGLYGLAICSGKEVIYIPCQFKELNCFDEIFYPYLYDNIRPFRYFKVLTKNNQLGYIDQLGRKYFEE